MNKECLNKRLYEIYENEREIREPRNREERRRRQKAIKKDKKKKVILF